MTNLDRELIAEVFAATRPGADQADALRQWSLTMSAMVNMLLKDHPMFDSEKFVEACMK